ncbi:MAG: DUF1848 domain-containing protein [Clostridia bacterium]|nr:DUF1848 domain-containing protein [Clostridia bacterium]
MIINTGQRTDIPAFYSEWFSNRLREGYVMVRNPYNPQSVNRYRLSPDVVDLISFCTKNPFPMLSRMDLLRPFRQLWHVTITPYGQEVEPHVPDKRNVLEYFRRLSDIVGPERMVWRYDPIFLSDTYPLERHIRAFEYMAKALEGYTQTAVISFIDLYEKTKRNFPEAKSVPREDRLTLGKAMAEIGKACGMTIRPCAEGKILEQVGCDCRGCMTQDILEKAAGERLIISAHEPYRTGCSCYLGGDIGAYNTCAHLCLYCYANSDADSVRQNMRRHDPLSPMLIGHLQKGDVVHETKQETWIDGQIRMEF